MLSGLSLKRVAKNQLVCFKSGILKRLDHGPQTLGEISITAFNVFNEKGLSRETKYLLLVAAVEAISKVERQQWTSPEPHYTGQRTILCLASASACHNSWLTA